MSPMSYRKSCSLPVMLLAFAKALCLVVVIAFLLGMATKVGMRLQERKDCTMAEHSPDFNAKEKQTCRALRGQKIGDKQ